jgi:tetratricopeptide (TPR) repeat protein
MVINCNLEQCIIMNNHAVEQFELGCFHRSLDTLKMVLDSLSNLMPRSPRGQCEHGQALFASSNVPIHQLRRWSKHCNFQMKGKDDVFVHCRAVFLTPPDPLNGCVYNYYATLILYNIALCYHALSLQHGDSAPRQCYSDKAFSLYNMAFATMKESMFKDSVLATVLFNNSGHVLYRQGRTFEATKCLRLVQNLMWNLPVNSLEPADFHGMYLNSLMECNTASAA